MIQSIVAVSAGAALGALLRWVLGLKLNSVFPLVPLGTVTANLVGGYLIGVVVAYLATRPDLPPELRLFIVTGFLGGLTTFSTFSAEVVDLLQRGDILWAAAAILVHVLGSITLTLLGFATVAVLRGA